MSGQEPRPASSDAGCPVRMLWLLLSYRCSARCAHCLVDGRPGQQARLRLATAENAVAELSREGPLPYLGLTGGEALLDPGLCVAIAEMARRYGVGRVVISGTNCSWASSEHRTREVLTALHRAGIELELSMDAFHDRFVPFERVGRVLRQLAELGIATRVETNLVESLTASNRWDRRTRALVERLAALDLVPGGPEGQHWTIKQIGFFGRGAGLARLVSGPGMVVDEPCPGAPWLATDFRRPDSILIDPEGWIMPELGIAIGNLRRQSLARLLATFDADSHPILRVLLEQGPVGLTRMREAAGFPWVASGFRDRCHLCYEVRRFLQPRFPTLLTPAACYPGEPAP